MRLILFILLSWFFTLSAGAEVLPYAVARAALPVFNNANAATGAVPPRPDQCGQTRELEFIALPGTVFRVIREISNGEQHAFEVTSEAYRAPDGVRLFIPSPLVAGLPSPPPVPVIAPPRRDELLRLLRAAEGAPYVWGGNLRPGVTVGSSEGIFAGLDCSGLLYEATKGYTPRNTADLVNFGQAVPIAGLPAQQLLKRLKPLDLIVWKGHVLIVLDKGEVIESILRCGHPGNGGVIRAPLHRRLVEIMTQRSGADRWPTGDGTSRRFVVRRWLP